MRNLWRALFAFLIVASVVSFAQQLPKDVLSFPVKLEMDKATVEVEKGVPFTYTVILKNTQDQIVPAPRDLSLEIKLPHETRTATIAKGQSSTSFQWAAQKVGLANIKVRSGNMRAASCLVVISPIRTAAGAPAPLPSPLKPEAAPAPAERANAVRGRDRSPLHGASERAASQPNLAASAPPPASPAAVPETSSSAPGPQPSKIQIFVQPEPVFGNAVAHTWTATVAVAAQDANDQLVPVSADVAVHFTSNLAQITPADIVIAKGQASTFNSPVTLVASRSGKGRLQAISTLGAASAEVEFQAPVPSRLGLIVDRPQLSATGSSTAGVRVCLQDEAGNLTAYPDRDTQVTLSATTGQLDKAMLSVAHGVFCSDQINWLSRKSGSATLTAQSSGELQNDTEQVTFPSFPWYLVFLSAAGGLVGAFITTSGGLLTPHWWAHVWRNLVLGTILGTLFYLFAGFGAIVLPKEVPIQLQNIPTVTGIGALLLGVVGGLYGRKIWKVEEGKDTEAAAAGVAAA